MAEVRGETKRRAGQGKGGGPKTEDGKKSSSGNATKHGLCASKKRMLPGEDQAEFDAIERGWLEEYQPEGHAEHTLVYEVIQNEWALRRARRRVMWAEEQAVAEWNEETEHTLELMQRYKTTAERSFYRSWNAMQGLRRDRIRMAEKLATVMKEKDDLQRQLAEVTKAEEPRPAGFHPAKKNPRGPFAPDAAKGKNAVKGRAQELFQGQLSPKKMVRKRVTTLEQWVEITVEDGKSETKLYPSNEELIKRGQKMWPAPDLVYRRLNFVNGVPPEYEWTRNDEIRRQSGGRGIQRISVDTWLEVIDQEKESGTGHVGPAGVGNLPRPMVRGGCDCETCAGNRGLLAGVGVVV
ncbi:MAG: hypothetical protein JO270_21160 [Acidobacteriaceae bacterium]|nr:hypothetical protein [Acidobacteriaceae bacterium]